MKTKVINATALQALLKANSGEEPVVTGEDAEDLKNKAGDENLENTADDENLEGKQETDDVDVAKQLADATDLNTKLQTEIDGLKTSLQEAEEAMTAATAEHSTKLASATAPLIEIITGQLKTMRIGLSLADIDMSAWDTETVVREYKATSKSFLAAMSAGPLVPDANDKEDKDKPVLSSIDKSALDSLDF